MMKSNATKNQGQISYRDLLYLVTSSCLPIQWSMMKMNRIQVFRIRSNRTKIKYVLTCLSVSWSNLASLFLSGGDKYFWLSNFFSSSTVWSLEKRTCPPFLLCNGRCMKGDHNNGLCPTAKTKEYKNIICLEFDNYQLTSHQDMSCSARLRHKLE